jgi:hypothetical protein
MGGYPLRKKEEGWRTRRVSDLDCRGAQLGRCYEYVETSERWQEMCSEHPCFDALQWPGYDSIHLDIEINGEPVVIQLWKGMVPNVPRSAVLPSRHRRRGWRLPAYSR